MPTDDRSLCFELCGVEKNPGQSTPEGGPSRIKARTTLFHDLTDLYQTLVCCFDDAVDALENFWTSLKKGQQLVADFDEILQVGMAGAHKF